MQELTGDLGQPIVCKSQTGKWLFDYCAAVVGIFVTLKEQKVFVYR